jgi:hypothetical protein
MQPSLTLLRNTGVGSLARAGAPSNMTAVVFVANISYDATEQQLIEVFQVTSSYWLCLYLRLFSLEPSDLTISTVLVRAVSNERGCEKHTNNKYTLRL